MNSEDMLVKKISYQYPSLAGGVPNELIRHYIPKELDPFISALKEREYEYYLDRYLEQYESMEIIADKMAMEYFIRIDFSDLSKQVAKYSNIKEQKEMKLFKVYYYLKGIEHCSIVMAKNKKEAEEIIFYAWKDKTKKEFEMEYSIEIEMEKPNIIMTQSAK